MDGREVAGEALEEYLRGSRQPGIAHPVDLIDVLRKCFRPAPA
jgi:hypothetical protein